MSQVELKEFCRKTLGGRWEASVSFPKEKKACWGNRSFRRMRQRTADLVLVSKGLGSGTAFSAFVGAAELRTLPLNLDYLGPALQGHVAVSKD